MQALCALRFAICSSCHTTKSGFLSKTLWGLFQLRSDKHRVKSLFLFKYSAVKRCANNSPVRAVKIWVFSHALLGSQKKQHSMRTCTTWYIKKSKQYKFHFSKSVSYYANKKKLALINPRIKGIRSLGNVPNYSCILIL